MKKILVFFTIIALSIVGVFAYTPTVSFQAKLETVAEKMDDIIDSKWESYRINFLSILVEYKEKYEGNDKALYILSYLTEYLSESNDSNVSNLSSDYTGEYAIDDTTYGTKVAVTISGDVRTITSNAIPNHEIWEFPNEANPNTVSEQDRSWELDTTPTYTWNATWAREAWVAYNGVKYELETNERVTCTSGETYRIEAFETMFNVMGIDMNNGHVQPTGEYHYHGVSGLLMDTLEGDDVVHVWYANDGFPIYYSKKSTYTPSYKLVSEKREGTECTYVARTTTDVVIEGTTPDGTYDRDWEFVEGLGNLDSCNGTYVNGEYVYFLTDTFPYGPRCLNGETAGQGGGWQGGPGLTWERQWPPPGTEGEDRPPRQ